MEISCQKFGFGLEAELCAMKRRKRRPRMLKTLKLVHHCNYNARTYTLVCDEGEERHITASILNVSCNGGKLQIIAVKPFGYLEGMMLAIKKRLGIMHLDNLVLKEFADKVTIEPHSEVNAVYDKLPISTGKIELKTDRFGLKISDAF